MNRGVDRLDVKPDVEDVAVLHDVALPLESLKTAPGGLRVRPALDEVVPADHLAANEPTRDVGVNRLRRLERRAPAPERPCAGLVLPHREEDDEVEDADQTAHDVLERGGSAVTELRRLLGGQLAQLGLQREVDAPRAVHDRDQRQRRERLELLRQLARPVADEALLVDVREQGLERRNLGAKLRVTRLRLLANALE